MNITLEDSKNGTALNETDLNSGQAFNTNQVLSGINHRTNDQFVEESQQDNLGLEIKNFELDCINRHTCMKNLIMLVKKLAMEHSNGIYDHHFRNYQDSAIQDPSVDTMPNLNKSSNLNNIPRTQTKDLDPIREENPDMELRRSNTSSVIDENARSNKMDQEQSNPLQYKQCLSKDLDLLNQESYVYTENMQEQNDVNYEANNGNLLEWMLPIYEMLKSTKTSLKTKILWLKVIINLHFIFQPFKKYWNLILIQYLELKDNGGKGMHYFMRDICNTLIMWNQNADNNNLYCIELLQSNQNCIELNGTPHSTYCNIIKNICSKLADENPIIFKNNALILINIGKLMSRHFVFDENILKAMLSYSVKEDTKEQIEKKKNQEQKNDTEKTSNISEESVAALWRRAGLYVLETAINLRVEILSKQDYNDYIKTGVIKETQDRLLFKGDLI